MEGFRLSIIVDYKYNLPEGYQYKERIDDIARITTIERNRVAPSIKFEQRIFDNLACTNELSD